MIYWCMFRHNLIQFISYVGHMFAYIVVIYSYLELLHSRIQVHLERFFSLALLQNFSSLLCLFRSLAAHTIIFIILSNFAQHYIALIITMKYYKIFIIHIDYMRDILICLPMFRNRIPLLIGPIPSTRAVIYHVSCSNIPMPTFLLNYYDSTCCVGI